MLPPARSNAIGVTSSLIGLRFTARLKRKHVTLAMLWDEYIERCSEGYRYSRFCELYRGWASRLSVTMRQAHIGGDKLFVDYAGDTVSVIVDRLTGQIRPAQIFVAVMGASNFTYAEASWTQALADWIGAHTRAFAALGGVPLLGILRTSRRILIFCVVNVFFAGNLLLTIRQPGSARHDREGINRARQIAEDLFKPKKHTRRAEVPTSAPNDVSSAEQPRRQPRIFAIPPVVPMGTVKVEPAAEPQQLRRKAIAQRETRDIPLV